MENRLEDIKAIINTQNEEGFRVNNLNVFDMKWLIEQAESVESLGSFTEEESPKYDTLPVAIDKVLNDETIDDKTKLERIDTYIEVYYQWQAVKRLESRL